jgi:cytochrome P450
MTNLMQRYDTPAVKDELFGFLVGGHDTTSTTVTWGLKFLTDHQKVQQKLRQALRATFSDTNPSAAEIAKSHIPYLDATLEEILRCGRTAAAQARVAKCDTEVLGYRIPKGTDIFCMANGPSFQSTPFTIDENLRSGSSRDAKDRTGMWDVTDMSLFMPERWLAQDEKGETIFDSRAGPNIPFGLGPRGCFGKCPAFRSSRINLLPIY